MTSSKKDCELSDRARCKAQGETVLRDGRYCRDSVPANATAAGHNLSLLCAVAQLTVLL